MCVLLASHSPTPSIDVRHTGGVVRVDAGGDVLISFSGNLGEQWVGSSQCVGQSEELGTMFATPKGLFVGLIMLFFVVNHEGRI